MKWAQIRVSGLKSGGRNTPRNVLTQTSRKRATTFVQGPLQASGWKNDVWTEGDAVRSTGAGAKEPRGDSGSDTPLLELFSCAWRAALA